MPVPENHHPEPVDYKKKYTALKRKLRFLLYEHECFLEELKKSQRKLLKVSRDKSFLLDRLLKYEDVDSSSSDSEMTASSESEGEGKEGAPPMKKKKSSAGPPLSAVAASLPLNMLSHAHPAGSLPVVQPVAPIPSQPAGTSFQPAGASLLTNMNFASMIQSQTRPVMSTTVVKTEPTKKRTKIIKKVTAKPGQGTVVPVSMLSPSLLAAVRQQPQPIQVAEMTREELERHLEMKQSSKPMFMSLEKTPNLLPDDIFSNEDSNS